MIENYNIPHYCCTCGLYTIVNAYDNAIMSYKFVGHCLKDKKNEVLELVIDPLNTCKEWREYSE